MKIRQGFVSNSSSSSFIIATKGKLAQKELKQLILDRLKVPADSPLYFLAKAITNKVLDAEDYEDEEWASDEVKKLLKQGYEVRNLSVDNEGFAETGADEILYNYPEILKDIDLPNIKIIYNY